VNTRIIQPRISLIAAISTNGDAYFSLTQVNTDKDVKLLFLTELAKLLDAERPLWRKDTLILMDNASYNTSPETRAQIQRLKMPVIHSGPYSYNAAPIERFFAYFKQGRMLPEDDPAGKR